jgi:N-acetylglucosamine-6-phosphate deacetylase
MFITASDPGKIVLITDNNEMAGRPDGTYTRGIQRFIVADGQMKTDTGSLAGSIAGLNKCALNLSHYGYSTGMALKTATENPACSIGVQDRKGSIAIGKDADIAIFDGEFNAMITIKAGRIVYKSDHFPGTVSDG